MAGTYTAVTLSVDVTGEKSDLLTLLTDQREMFLITVAGLSNDQARERSTVSELTLGGLLKHLAQVERATTASIIARDENSVFDPEGMTDAYTFGADDSVEDAIAEYRAAAADFDRLIAESDLDDLIPQATAPWQPDREWWTIRKMALHLLRETAHHSGHADIIRESLDGQTTMEALFSG